jgi:AraC family transcriptional regulator
MIASPYFGELVRNCVAGPFVITESEFRGGSYLPVHVHESAYVTLTLRGSYSESYGVRSRLCKPGTAVGHPAHEVHSQTFDRESALLVRVGLSGNGDQTTPAISPDMPLALADPLIARTAWKLHRELHLDDEYSKVIVEGLAYELTGYLMRGSGVQGGSRKRALQTEALLRSSLKAERSLSSIAAEAGVSLSTLSRDFQSTFGCSPGEYLRRARIDVAIEKLKGDGTIAEIAAECGFWDQSHFSRCFRGATGLSPSQFRRLAR